MACDEGLASRVQLLLNDQPGFVEKRMFGGLCFLLRGNMACGIVADRLIVRVGQERYAEALAHPHATLFDLTGRPMTGWVQVGPEGLQTAADLRAWLQLGIDCALSLPPK